MSNVTKEKVKNAKFCLTPFICFVNLYDFLSSVEHKNVWMKIVETIKVNGDQNTGVACSISVLTISVIFKKYRDIF